MKKFVNTLSFVLVFAVMFCFAGCGEKPPTPTPTLNTTEVIEMVTGLMDFEDMNFTATADVEYGYGIQPFGEGVSSVQNSMEGVTLKFAGENIYALLPNQTESYQLASCSYTREYKEIEGVYAWDKFYINQNAYNGSVIASIETMSDTLQSLFGDLLNNIVTYDASFITSEKLDSGAYKLTLNADLATKITAYKTAIIDNADNTLGELVDALIAIDFPDLTIAEIVADIKANITATSTLGDVIDFVEEEFGYSIHSLVSAFLSSSSMLEEDSMLNENFFSMIQVVDATEFATLIDYFVDNYLTNEELSLNILLASLSESSDPIASVVCNVFASLSSLTINDFVISATITSNAANDAIESITANANVEVVMDGTTYTASAGLDIAFTNVGSTIITAPNLTDNIKSASIQYIFTNAELTAHTAKVISNVNLGTASYTFSPTDDLLTGADCVYDASTNTITLSADAVDYLLETSSTYFRVDEPEMYFYFYYFVIE